MERTPTTVSNQPCVQAKNAALAAIKTINSHFSMQHLDWLGLSLMARLDVPLVVQPCPQAAR